MARKQGRAECWVEQVVVDSAEEAEAAEPMAARRRELEVGGTVAHPVTAESADEEAVEMVQEAPAAVVAAIVAEAAVEARAQELEVTAAATGALMVMVVAVVLVGNEGGGCEPAVAKVRAALAPAAVASLALVGVGVKARAMVVTTALEAREAAELVEGLVAMMVS